MVNINYLRNIPEPQKNMLHEESKSNLSHMSLDSFSENEFNNLLLNSNLDQFNTIK